MPAALARDKRCGSDIPAAGKGLPAATAHVARAAQNRCATGRHVGRRRRRAAHPPSPV